jgi:hypothetical protein
MLASLVIEMLTISLLVLAVGWISDILHASTRDRRSGFNSARTIGWDQMSVSRQLPVHDGSDATWATRPMRRRERPLRVPACLVGSSDLFRMSVISRNKPISGQPRRGFSGLNRNDRARPTSGF